MKMPRLTIRRLAILVALTAVVLASGRLADDRLGWTAMMHTKWRGPTTTFEVFSPWPGRVVMAMTAIVSGLIWCRATRPRDVVITAPPETE